MAGERVPPDDDLLRDDDDFILDDWDEELDIVGQVEAEVEQQLEVVDHGPQAHSSSVADDSFVDQPTEFAEGWGDLEPSPDADADDLLFTGTGAESIVDTGSFDPHGASTWEGAAATPEQIGLPISAADDVQEFELGDDDEEGVDFADDSRFFGEQERSVAAEDSVECDDLEAGAYSPQLQELGAPEDADWEEEDEYADQVDAEAGQYEDEQYVDEDGGEAYAEDDAAYEYEETAAGYVAPVPVVAAGGFIGGRQQRRRGVALRRAAATVAALLVVGLAAAVVVLKPEWLGVGPQSPMVDRTEVQRPQIAALTIAPPPPAEFPAEVQPATDPLAGGPEPTDPDPVPMPLPDPPPVTGDPEIAPIGESTPPQPDPRSTGEAPAPLADGLVAVGEELRIGSRVEPQAPGARAEIHPMAANLVAGSQAVVKLTNGNFFVGRVNKFDAVTLTLRIAKGELSLPFDRVAGLASLSEAEVKSLENRKNGFVRLRNRNRLFGSIEDLGLVDQVVLSNGGSRVIIPREAIEEIGKARVDGVQVTDDLDDAWVRQMIESRLEQRRQSAEPAEPDPRDDQRR